MDPTHVVLEGNARAAKSGAVRVRSIDPDAKIQVTVELRGKKLPELDPSAPPLSRAQFARSYGASKEDVAKVKSALRRYKLTVDGPKPGSRSLQVSGTAAQMEAAFKPDLAIYYSKDQGEYRGREGELHIPADLAGIVVGVYGFDERRVARRKAVPKKAARKAAPLSPADLERRYSFPPGDGKGQHVAIAEFEGGFFDGDLAAFCENIGRPVPKVTNVPVGLKPLTLDEIAHLPPQRRTEELGASGEVMMDVQIVAGLCPKAAISVFWAPFTQKGWVDLLDAVAAATPASVSLSISWGLPEDSPDWSASALATINERFHALSLLGITACVAAGDDGSGDEISDGRAHVDFPASSPYVLAVGGTMLDAATGDEVVWWESPGQRGRNGGGATGGGVSTVFPRPSWQNVGVVSLNPGSIAGRVVPDVAALAGPPFYMLVFLGRDAPNGGTSASAPLWASLIARAAPTPSRFVSALLYQRGKNGSDVGASVCKDVTHGQNASRPSPGRGYEAGKGYDAASGWGVPIGTALAAALR